MPQDTMKDIDDSVDDNAIKANPAVTFDPINTTGDQLDPFVEAQNKELCDLLGSCDQRRWRCQ